MFNHFTKLLLGQGVDPAAIERAIEGMSFAGFDQATIDEKKVALRAHQGLSPEQMESAELTEAPPPVEPEPSPEAEQQSALRERNSRRSSRGE